MTRKEWILVNWVVVLDYADIGKGRGGDFGRELRLKGYIPGSETCTGNEFEWVLKGYARILFVSKGGLFVSRSMTSSCTSALIFLPSELRLQPRTEGNERRSA